MDSLKKQTLIGSIWMIIERFGYLSIQFLSNLVLARLLMPEDFGTIGIMMVFISLSSVFIDSGFSASLIQKRNITEMDKSTAFFTNLILSMIVYLIIFLTSPYISEFFHISALRLLLRVLGVVLIIDAFCAIQNTILSREMNFKRLTQIKLISIIFAASVSISLAYSGFGIWALIVQYIIYSSMRTLITWTVAKWRPMFFFSKNSFKELFGFGSKLLVSTFVAELYVNFQQILIGKYYKPSDLGYYSQARQFQQIPTGTISQVINSVAFPAYAKMQNERSKLRDMFRQNVRLVSYFNTPLMVLLAVIGKPVIILLYSDKWVGSIPYFQFLCVGFGILLVIHQCSLSVLKALGRSDYVLKLEMLKKLLGIVFIVVGIKYCGIWGILYALALNSILEIFLNGHYLKKELQYSGLQQLIDVMPSILVSGVSATISYFVLNSFFSNGNELIAVSIVSLLFGVLYILLSYIGKLYGFMILQRAFFTILNRIK